MTCTRTALGVVAAFAAHAAAGSVAWNPTADLSIVNGNPNGVWSYGWMDVGFGPLHLYANSAPEGSSGGPQWFGWGGDRTPCVWRNDSDSIHYGIDPGMISLHPGNGTQASVIRWTAPDPVASSVRVVGRFTRGDIGAMMVGVRLNGDEVWGRLDDGAFDLVVPAGPGTTVDFAVWGGYAYGNTGLAAIITSLPCPYGACVADYDGSGGTPDTNDIVAFFGDWLAGAECADADASGGTPDLTDITAFFDAWLSGGC